MHPLADGVVPRFVRLLMLRTAVAHHEAPVAADGRRAASHAQCGGPVAGTRACVGQLPRARKPAAFSFRSGVGQHGGRRSKAVARGAAAAGGWGVSIGSPFA